MNVLHTHGAEIARNLRQHRYDRTENGILIPSMGVVIGGALRIRGDGGLDETHAIDANLLVDEGLNHILNVTMPPSGGYAQITQWYIAPFAGNYTPTATLTAANFASTATEFTGYTATNRPALNVAAATSTKSTGNTGDEALFTMAAGGPYNIYGFAIVSASAKSSTSGRMLAAVRMDTPMLGLAAGYKAGAEYVLSAADAG